MEYNGTVHKIFIDSKKVVVRLRWRFCLQMSVSLVHTPKYLVNEMYSYLTENFWTEMIRKYFSDIR